MVDNTNASGTDPEHTDNTASPTAALDIASEDCASHKKSDFETATDVTAESLTGDDAKPTTTNSTGTVGPIVSSTKKSRPPYKYDPDKITLRFLFANRDGLSVTLECNPSDTVGEVKGALLSVWPEDVPSCAGGENLRLVCMGIGYLMPDSRTLKDCEVPVFKTHPTPVNIAIKPSNPTHVDVPKKAEMNLHSPSSSPNTPTATGQGCSCTIL